jgi:arylsulfatase A-like enzyme
MKDSMKIGREVRCAQYFEQVRCTHRRLETLFEELKRNGSGDDTEIVLHGDHGSRIFETAPRARNLERLTSQDLPDAFITLFAVKAPGLANTVNRELRPVSQRLAKWGGAETSEDTSRGAIVVYLEGKDDDPWTAIPFPQNPMNPQNPQNPPSP